MNEGEVKVMVCEKVTYKNYEYDQKDYKDYDEKFDNKNHRDCILQTIRQIDKLQREDFKKDECIGCGGPLIEKVFDTKPVSFTLCEEHFKAKLGFSCEETDLFRIEDVMRDCVLLRLLDKKGECIKCTKFTVILKIDCICAIQCFEPINCRIKKDGCEF
mgnify:CR=1 FL=1